MSKRMRPETFHASAALAFVLAWTVILLVVFRVDLSWYHLLAGWLVAINLTTFGYYGYDKARARSRNTRVPELVLHGLALFGGTLGAYLGMVVFRHKTIKPGFRLLFWVIVVLQVLLIAAVVYRVWKERRAERASTVWNRLVAQGRMT